MNKLVMALCCVTAIIVPGRLDAGGPCSGKRGGCHRYEAPSGPRYSPPKPEKPPCTPKLVRAHTRSDGVHIASHQRIPPGCAGNETGSDELVVKWPRVKARTATRKAAWGGTGSIYDAEDDVNIYVEPPIKVDRSPRFLLTFTSDRTEEIYDYREEEDSYWVEGLKADSGRRYPKKMVKQIEPIAASP